MIDFIFVFIKYMSTESSKSSFKKFRVYQKGTDICSNNAEFEKKKSNIPIAVNRNCHTELRKQKLSL